nr:MAG TPA_asm: Protein arginine N-methyltransferase 3 zinc finger domain, protein [Caudoviricetes sp.]
MSNVFGKKGTFCQSSFYGFVKYVNYVCFTLHYVNYVV